MRRAFCMLGGLGFISLAACGDAGAGGYCGPTEGWNAQSTEFEEEVLLLTNEARAAGADCGEHGVKPPVGPLTMQSELRCAARVHSRDMNVQGFFDHDSPNGDSPWDRMEKAGYSYFSAGENIARGQSSPEAVVASWMASDGHCNNIMGASFTEIGVGHYDGNYWTQVFGSPAD